MSHPEPNAKPASTPKTGLLAMLRARGSKGSGAPSRRLHHGFASLLAVAFILALSAAPAAAKEIHAFSSSFGSIGTGAGQFAAIPGPTFLAVDNSSGPSSGDLYVSDPGNHRVEKFGPAGEFILAFGQEVNKTAVTEHRSSEQNVCPAPGHPGDECQAGTGGATPGSLEKPAFVAVDGSSGGAGDVYVADLRNAPTWTVSKFDAEGNLIASWGTGGQRTFSDIEGIAVGPTGTLYVLALRTFFKFTPAGASAGSIERERTYKRFGIAVDSSGDIYATDVKSRVVKIGPGGEFIDENVQPCPSETNTGDNSSCAVSGLAVDPSNNDLYVAHSFHFEVERPQPGVFGFDAAAAPLESSIGVGEGFISTSPGVAVRASNHAVYISDPQGPGGEPGTDRIGIFTLQEVEAPTASIEAPNEIGYTGARLSGHVNPNGHFVTSCRFEYVTQKHFEAEGFGERTFPPTSQGNSELQKAKEEGYEPPEYQACSPEPGRGSASVAVEAKISRLKPSSLYHVRLIAANHAETTFAAEAAPLETKGPVPAPTVTIEAVSALTSTSAHFSGHVNPNAPEAEPVASPEVEEAFSAQWHFHCVPACPAAENKHLLKADDTPHAVAVEAEGLEPGIPYEVFLIAENVGSAASAGPVPANPPAIAPQVISTVPAEVTTSTATLTAEINPGGAPTTVHFQYLTEEQFKADGEQFGAGTVETPESASIGRDDKEHEATAAVASLKPGTTYEFRAVATNTSAGNPVIDGPATLLRTYSAEPASSGCSNELLREENNSLALPDCRAYELVSPLGARGEVYEPAGAGSHGPTTTRNETSTDHPFRSAAAGDAVTYVADPPADAGNGSSGRGLGNQWLASRGEGGWKASDIVPTGMRGQNHLYEAFSADLSLAFFQDLLGASNAPLTADTPPGCQRFLYSHVGASGDAGVAPLFTEPQEPGECGSPMAVASSADRSQLLFQDEAALTPGAQPAAGTVLDLNSCVSGCNLYDSAAGHLHLLSLFNGGAQAPGASFGAPGQAGQHGGVQPPNLSNVFSTDATRAYWTDTASGVVYLRQNPAQVQSPLNGEGKCTKPAKACTLQVSAGPATYWTATPDGRYAYYTESGALFRFDATSGERAELVPASGAVQAVIGVNEEGEDGAYLYFVAAGALPGTGAEARKCEPGPGTASQQEGHLPLGYGCNLYLLHGGEAKLVAALSALDNNATNEFINRDAGDWVPALGFRTAQPSADGHSIVFRSILHLTGVNGHLNVQSVFAYDADRARLSCVSCDPSGASFKEVKANLAQNDATLTESSDYTYMERWISADGSRVFFDTEAALLPADANRFMDVYEWQRQGSPGCPAAAASPADGGCLRLLSGGTQGGDSFFADASSTGRDVFIVSRAPLTPVAPGEHLKFFDAREGGGFPVPGLTPPCESGEQCHGSSTPSPQPQTAGSGTFQGPEEGPNHPQESKCKKGFVKKRGSCTKQHKKPHKHKKHKRAANTHRRASR